jgi:hypothetical protein
LPGSLVRTPCGYSSGLNQIMLLNHGANYEANVDASTGAFTSLVDPNGAGVDLFAEPSLGGTCDAAGNWYGQSGGHNDRLSKYDKTTHLRIVENSVFSPSGTVDFAQVLKDNSSVEHVIVINGNTGQAAVFDTSNSLTLEGTAYLNAAHVGTETEVGSAFYDTFGILWVFSLRASGGGTNGYLAAINPSGFTGTNYIVAGTYGQPQAAWYVPSDHSIVMVTQDGFLIKWDINTQTIIANVDNTASIGSSLNKNISACWSKRGKLASGKIWFGGSSGVLYKFDPITLAVDSVNYSFKTILGDGAYGFGLPLDFIPEIQSTVINHGGANQWQIVRVINNKNRMIFINT